MAHPYDKHREMHPGKERVSKTYGYARGGKVKHKGKTHININIAPGANNAPPPPLPMAGPPVPPGPPMAPPPGAMGAGPPPGAGMMNRGGKISGLATADNISKWGKRAASNRGYATGGKVTMKGGAETGVGRLDKIKRQKNK